MDQQMSTKEAIELVNDRMCWGRGNWSEHHMPEHDKYWQAGEMAMAALKCISEDEKGAGVKKIITLGDILDLLDVNRESDEVLHIMDAGTGRPCMSGPVCSPYWKDFENYVVNCIAADEGQLNVWLEED